MESKTVLDYRNWLAETGQTDDRPTSELAFDLGERIRSNDPDAFLALRRDDPTFDNEYLQFRNAERGGILDLPNTFASGFGSAVDSMQGTLQGAAGLGLRLLPGDFADEAAEDFEKAAYENYLEASDGAPPVNDLSDIRDFGEGGFGDTLSYLAGGLGQVAPSAIEALGTAAIGGVVGAEVAGVGAIPGAVVGAAGKGAVKKFIKDGIVKRVRRQFLKNGIKDYTEEELERAIRREAATLGAGAASFMNSYALSSGEIYSSLIEDPEIDANTAKWTAFLFGGVAAAPDTVVPMWAVRKLLPSVGVVTRETEKQAAGFLARGLKLAKSAAGVPMEAGTEAFQEYVNLASEKFSKGESMLELSPTEIARLTNASALGAIGGGVFSAVPTIQTLRSFRDSGIDESDFDLEATVGDGLSSTPEDKEIVSAINTLSQDQVFESFEEIEAPEPMAKQAEEKPEPVKQAEEERISAIEPEPMVEETIAESPEPESMVENAEPESPEPEQAIKAPSYTASEQAFSFSYKATNGKSARKTVRSNSYQSAYRKFLAALGGARAEETRAKISSDPIRFELSVKPDDGPELFVQRGEGELSFSGPEGEAVVWEEPAAVIGFPILSKAKGGETSYYPIGIPIPLVDQASAYSIEREAESLNIFDSEGNSARTRVALAIHDKATGERYVRGLTAPKGKGGGLFVQSFGKGRKGTELKPTHSGAQPISLKTLVDSDRYDAVELLRPSGGHRRDAQRKSMVDAKAGFIRMDFPNVASYDTFIAKVPKDATRLKVVGSNRTVSIDSSSEELVSREMERNQDGSAPVDPDGNFDLYSQAFDLVAGKTQSMELGSVISETFFNRDTATNVTRAFVKDISTRILDAGPVTSNSGGHIETLKATIESALNQSNERTQFAERLIQSFAAGAGVYGGDLGGDRAGAGGSGEAVDPVGADAADAAQPLDAAEGRGDSQGRRDIARGNAVAAASVKLDGSVSESTELAELLADELIQGDWDSRLSNLVEIATAVGDFRAQGDEWANAIERFETELIDSMDRYSNARAFFQTSATRGDKEGMARAVEVLSEKRGNLTDVLHRALLAEGVVEAKAKAKEVLSVYRNASHAALAASQRELLGNDHTDGDLANAFIKGREDFLTGVGPDVGRWANWLRGKDQSLGHVSNALGSVTQFEIENMWDPNTGGMVDGGSIPDSPQAVENNKQIAASRDDSPREQPERNPALSEDAALQALRTANGALFAKIGVSDESMPLSDVLSRTESLIGSEDSEHGFVQTLSGLLGEMPVSGSVRVYAVPWDQFRQLPGATPWVGALFSTGEGGRIYLNSDFVSPATADSLDGGLMTPKALDSAQASTLSTLILHESLHATTQVAADLSDLRKDTPSVIMSPAEKRAADAFDKIESVWRYAVRMADTPAFSKYRMSYGLENVREFISEAMTNRKFGDFLKELPLSDGMKSSIEGEPSSIREKIRNAFDWIKRWFSSTFLNAGETTLGVAMDALSEVMESNMLMKGNMRPEIQEQAERIYASNLMQSQESGKQESARRASARIDAAGINAAMLAMPSKEAFKGESLQATAEKVLTTLTRPMTNALDYIRAVDGDPISEALMTDLANSKGMVTLARKKEIKLLSTVMRKAMASAQAFATKAKDLSEKLDSEKEALAVASNQKENLNAVAKEALANFRTQIRDLFKDRHRGQELSHRAGELSQAIMAFEGIDASMPLPNEMIEFFDKAYFDGVDLNEALFAIGKLGIDWFGSSPKEIAAILKESDNEAIIDLRRKSGLAPALIAIGKANGALMDSLRIRSLADIEEKKAHQFIIDAINANEEVAKEAIRSGVGETFKARDELSKARLAYGKQRNKVTRLEKAAKAALEKAEVFRDIGEKTNATLETKYKGTGWLREWHPVEGAPYWSMTRDDEGNWVTSKVSLPSDLTHLSDEQRLEIRRNVVQNSQWLQDNADMKGEPFYEQVLEQRTKIMSPFIVKEHQSVMRNSVVRTLQGLSKRFYDAGGAGADIAKMLNSLVGTMSSKHNEFSGITKEWENAAIEARKAFGMKDQPQFFKTVYRAAIAALDSDVSLIDMTEQDVRVARSRAFNNALRLMPSKLEIKPDAKAKLWKLVEVTNEIRKKLDRTAKQLGADVESPDWKLYNRLTGEVETVFRDRIEQGPVTVGRNVSERSRLLHDEIMPKLGWKDTNGRFKELSSILANDELTEEQKLASMFPIVDALLGGAVSRDFLEEYVYKSGKGPFVGANVEIADGKTIRRPIEQEDAMSAWTSSGGKPSEFFVTLLNPVASESGEKMSDLLEANMRSLRRSYRIGVSYFKKAGGTKDPLNPQAIAPHLMMDARHNDELADGFFEYERFDEVSVGQKLAVLAATGELGRDASHMQAKVTLLKKQLESRKNELDDLMFEHTREGLSQRQAKALIKKKIGAEAFKALEDGASHHEGLKSTVSALEAYFNSEAGPYMDEQFWLTMVGTNANFVVNTYKTGLLNVNTILQYPLYFKGVNGMSMRATRSAIGAAAKSTVGSFMESFFLKKVAANLVKEGDYDQLVMRRVFRPASQDTQLVEFMRNVGKDGGFDKEFEGLNDWKYYKGKAIKFARQSTKFIQREQILRSGAKTLANKIFKTELDTSSGLGEDRNFQPQNLFTAPAAFLNGLASYSVSLAMVKETDRTIFKALKFVESQRKQGVDPLSDPKFAFSLKDLGLGKSEGDAFDQLRKDLLSYVMSFEDLVRAADRRRGKGETKTRLISDEDAQLIMQMAIDKVALDANVNTRSPWMMNNFIGRLISPLIGWPLQMMEATHEGFRSNNGRLSMALTAKMLGTLAVWSLPLGLGFTFFTDWWDENIIGKKSNLRPMGSAMSLRENLLSMLERSARAGNVYGFGMDFASNMLNYTDPNGGQRGMSIDSRVLVFNQLGNIKDAFQNWYLQGEFDYENVGRQLIYSAGGNGALQATQTMGKFFGWDLEENRVSTRIDAFNYLRGSGRVTGLELRASGGHTSPNALTPYLKRMQRAAYASDLAFFRQTYEEAIIVAMQSGKAANRKEAMQLIARNWKSRSPLKSLFRTAPTERQLREMMGVMSDRGRENTTRVIRLHERFGSMIGAN